MAKEKKKQLSVNNNYNFVYKWQICHTEMQALLQFTINGRKSHHQTQRTLQLASESRVLFVWVDLHVSLRWQQQQPRYQPAIRLV